MFSLLVSVFIFCLSETTLCEEILYLGPIPNQPLVSVYICQDFIGKLKYCGTCLMLWMLFH